MKTSTAARLERLRKSRSLNDVISVLKEITAEVKSASRITKNLFESLSGSEVPMGGGEITIDHAGRSPARVKVAAQLATTDQLGIKLASFVPPPMATVRKHFTVIRDLHDNATELESAEALILSTFSTAKNQKAVLTSLKALRTEIDSSLQVAFMALDGIARKHLPKEMSSLGDALLSFLISHLNVKTYSNMVSEVYASPGETGSIVFSNYIAISELRNTSGFVFEEYYVILTGIVNKQGLINYYLNTLPEFKVPGKFPVGREVKTTTEMLTRISILFAHNEIASELERKPMPLDTARARSGGFTSIPNVDDAYVVDDSINIVITKDKDTKKNVLEVVTRVIPLLNQLTKNGRRTKAGVSYKEFKRRGQTVVQFIFVPVLKNPDMTLNVARLAEVKELLGLSDFEVHVLKTLLLGK